MVGIGGEVEFVVDEVGAGRSAHKTEEACIRAGAERYDLLPSRRTMRQETVDKIVNGDGADISA